MSNLVLTDVSFDEQHVIRCSNGHIIAVLMHEMKGGKGPVAIVPLRMASTKATVPPQLLLGRVNRIGDLICSLCGETRTLNLNKGRH